MSTDDDHRIDLLADVARIEEARRIIAGIALEARALGAASYRRLVDAYAAADARAGATR